MKHVFVETNFLVDALRPFAAPDALRLIERHDAGELRLHLPWCCKSESIRTLSRVIREDLGFADAMMRFAAMEYRKSPGSFDKTVIDRLRTQAEVARAEALRTLQDRVHSLGERLAIISPDEAVIDSTLGMFRVKALNPFDEMVAGAVLQRARELFDSGERMLFFCELDGDLCRRHPPLVAEYSKIGLVVLQSFAVP